MEGLAGDIGDILLRIQPLEGEALKRFLLSAIAFLFVFDTLVFLSVVIHRLILTRRERLYNRAYQRFTDQIVLAIYGSGDVEDPGTGLEKEALGDVCIEIARKFRGAEAEFAKRTALDKSVIRYYIRKTRSIFLPTKVVYYEKLAHLGVKRVKEDLRREIEKADREWAVARLTFAYSLLVDEVGEVSFIVRSINRCGSLSFKFVEFLWFNVIDRLRNSLPDLLSLIRRELLDKEASAFVLRAFVEALGDHRLQQASGFVLEVYRKHTQDVLMRISCIRSLGNMGYEDFLEIFRENSYHEDWRVRAVICRYAYLCRYEDVIEDLIRLIGDRVYFVRINAGRSLLFFGERSREVLNRLLHSEDRFVRDMARYLLERMEVVNA
ncbi:MAG: HEAT repeat domain-containing protein [Aquificota bacterium]|nr:HEAT repeat domain-containing protein [Aquificota bacterium]